MARPRPVQVVTWTPGPSDAARAEVWRDIERLFLFANLHRPDQSDDARKVHQLLRLISEAGDRWYEGDKRPVTFNLEGEWHPGAGLAVRNLIAIIRQGNPRLYVRQCPVCLQWCLTRNKKQIRRCHRPECKRQADSRRAGAWQREQLAEQKKALLQVKSSRRTR